MLVNRCAGVLVMASRSKFIRKMYSVRRGGRGLVGSSSSQNCDIP